LPDYSDKFESNRNTTQNSGITLNRNTARSSVDSEYEKYEKILQFQKEQLIKETRTRKAEYLRNWVIQSIDCLPRNRAGMMAAQDIVKGWYEYSNNSEKKIREVVAKSGGCLGAAPPAPERAKSPKSPAPAPSIITSCDNGGCWDNLGGRYNKGAGNTYIPAASGGACQLVGGMMNCH